MKTTVRGTWIFKIWHHDTQHNNTQNKGLIYDIRDSQHKRNSITTLYHYAECHYAEFHILFVVTQSVVMLSVVKLNVVMLNVVMLSVMAPKILLVKRWRCDEPIDIIRNRLALHYLSIGQIWQLWYILLYNFIQFKNLFSLKKFHSMNENKKTNWNPNH